MRGLHFSFLGGIILVIIVVLIGTQLVSTVSGFDVKKYFGIQPILGEPGDISAESLLFNSLESIDTRCGVFLRQKSSIVQPYCTNNIEGKIDVCKFESTTCPNGYVAVSCGTATSGNPEDEDSYKSFFADGIINMYIDESRNLCVVEALGDPGTVDSQMRKVDILCADANYYNNEPSTSEVLYYWDNSESNPSNDLLVGSKSCPAGFTEIFGMVNGSNIEQLSYGDDTIIRLTTKEALLYDSQNDNAYSKMFGKVCIKNSLIDGCNINEYTFNGMSENSEIQPYIEKTTWYVEGYSNSFQSYIVQEPCPGDSQIVSCGGGFKVSKSAYSVLPTIASTELNTIEEGIMPIQTCNLLLTSQSINYEEEITINALCAENVWTWGDWIYSQDVASPEFTTNCPSGTKAVACASDSASLEDGYNFETNSPGGGRFGEDAINGIYFTSGNDGCSIRAIDKNGGHEHKRRVGALCINEDTYISDFKTITPKNFDESNAVESKYGGKYTTYESEACDSGYVPIFCTIKLDYGGGAGYYEDQITEINIDQGSGKCKITLADQISTYEFKGTIGGLCVKKEFANFVDVGVLTTESVIKKENPFFKSEECPNNGIPTTALTLVGGEDKYEEDFIISMIPDSEMGYVVQAGDTVDAILIGESNEHMREVGVACLNYPKSAFSGDYVPPTIPGKVTWSLGVHSYIDPNTGIEYASQPGKVCVEEATLGEVCTLIGTTSPPYLPVYLDQGASVTIKAIPSNSGHVACLLNAANLNVGYCNQGAGTLEQPATADATGIIYGYFYVP